MKNISIYALIFLILCIIIGGSCQKQDINKNLTITEEELEFPYMENVTIQQWENGIKTGEAHFDKMIIREEEK